MKIVKVNPKNREDSYYTPVRSVFDDFFNYSLSPMWRSLDESLSNVSADIWEDKDNIFVKMAMPGIKKEDIKISVMSDSVTIEGSTKTKEEKEESDEKYWVRNLATSYSQSFTLPTNVDTDAVEAKFEDGILTVTLPKAKESKSKEVKVS